MTNRTQEFSPTHYHIGDSSFLVIFFHILSSTQLLPRRPDRSNPSFLIHVTPSSKSTTAGKKTAAATSTVRDSKRTRKTRKKKRRATQTHNRPTDATKRLAGNNPNEQREREKEAGSTHHVALPHIYLSISIHLSNIYLMLYLYAYPSTSTYLFMYTCPSLY